MELTSHSSPTSTTSFKSPHDMMQLMASGETLAPQLRELANTSDSDADSTESSRSDEPGRKRTKGTPKSSKCSKPDQVDDGQDEDIDPIKKRLLKNAKWRAKKLGLSFLIGPTHFTVPTHCPVLGMLLRPNFGNSTGDDQSPSLDRIIPAFGYIPGNVIVVSYRANRLKAQSTPSEIRLVADFYTRLELQLYRNK